MILEVDGKHTKMAWKVDDCDFKTLIMVALCNRADHNIFIL